MGSRQDWQNGRISLFQKVERWLIQCTRAVPFIVSLYMTPINCIKILEKSVGIFIWRGSSLVKGNYLVNWKLSSLPILSGGLYICSLKEKTRPSRNGC